MGEGLNIPDHFSDLPLCILGPSTRRLLSIHLDPPAVIPTPRGVLGDLSGLAELAGFEFCHIRYFETKQSRTMACLEEWGSRQSGTVGNLIKNLTTMERFDCLSEIRDLILRDITNHVQRQSHRNEKKLNIENPDSENNLVKNIFSIDLNSNQNVVDENALHFSSIKPSNVVTEPISTDSGYIDGTEHFNISLIDSNPKSKGVTNEIIQLRRVKSENDCLERDSSVNNQVPFHVHRSISPIYEDEDDAFLTTDDKEGDPKKYTACICCADENIELANIIIHKYKTEHDADFFLPQEALLSGRYEFETLAEVIETRCDSRVIVILSKHYITSPACVFATQFVKTLDPDAKRRKIIPVLLDEDVIYPRVLRGISSIKARRLKYGNSFWNLLSSSLRLPKIVDEENNLMTHKCPNRLIINKAGETKEGKNKETEINSCYNCHTSSSSSVRTRTNTIMDNVVLNSKTDASSVSNASSDSGVSVGATGTNLFEDSNSTTGNVKRKNPGLRTLRRIMKSLNIIERKPKLQFTKRSHSTGETMESSPAQVFVEPRSHSTTVPPMIAPDVNRAGDSPDCRYVFNICHTESELTLTNYPASLSASSSKNNFSTNNGKLLDESLPTTSNSMNIYVKEETSKHPNTRQNILSPNIDAENTGQNILSPNIDTVSSKLALSSNNIDLPSRQISCDNNISPSSRTASFDNASMLSEITSSDDNSISAPSRKTSFDNFSLASSFRQMNSGSNSNSRQTSFDSNSRQTSFDGNSLTSVEDNTAADKPILKSCWNDKEANISGRKKSEVMFEIML